MALVHTKKMFQINEVQTIQVVYCIYSESEREKERQKEGGREGGEAVGETGGGGIQRTQH